MGAMETVHGATSSTDHPILAPTARLGTTRLVVTDLRRSIAFYEVGLGLEHLGTGDGVARLGTPGDPALELVEREDARRAGRHAGLFHVALNYPSRLELARVGKRLLSHGIEISGASDHGTHEAFYLRDPDGNGLELAADRPREQWPDPQDEYRNGPQPLDVRNLMALVQDDDVVARVDGVVVGHLHLHVGDVDQALAFYRDLLGFDLMARMSTAAFVSLGGYHHHLGMNVWQGQDAPPMPDGVVGMAWWTVRVPARHYLTELAERLDADGTPYSLVDDTLDLRDPWNNRIRIVVDA